MVATIGSAFGQCCLTFPTNNVLNADVTAYPDYDNYYPDNGYIYSNGVYVLHTAPPSFAAVEVTDANEPIPEGVYPAWCVDQADYLGAVYTSVPGNSYSGTLISTCDLAELANLPTNHIKLIPVGPPPTVSLATWNEVNYILNHKSSPTYNYYFWNVQVAINRLVGGPAPNDPENPSIQTGNGYQYLPVDTNQVNAILNDAKSNAASWTLPCGGVIGVIYYVPGVEKGSPAGYEPDYQIIILEVPCCGVSFTNCPPDIYLGCNPAPSSIPTCQSTVNSTNVGAASCCGRPVTITCSESDSVAGCSHLRYLVYVASDNYGNTATCMQTVSWTVDTNAPVITSASINTNLGCNPMTLPVVTNMAALITATDNCSLEATNITYQDAVTSCGTTRTFIVAVIDGCGNEALQTNTFTWTTDTNAPVITSDVIDTNLGCNPSTLPVATNLAALITATDNCTLAATNITSQDVVTACGTTRTFIVTVADECGNISKPQTNTYTWTIDTNAPVITSGAINLNLGCNPATLPVAANLAAMIRATDNCTLTATNISTQDLVTTCGTTRTFIVTVADECGNVSVPQTNTYTWTVDTIPPVITSGVINTNLGCNPTTVPVAANLAALITATDNCTLAATNISSQDVVTACGTTRTFIVTVADECGNVSAPQTNSYSWTIDTTAPIITSGVINTNLGCNPATLPVATNVAALITATDNCTLAATNISSQDVVTGCGTTRTFIVTVVDECGNVSAPQTNSYSWTVDTIAPVITSSAINQNLGCNPATLPAVANLAALIRATDNCTLAATNISTQTSVSACGTTRTFIVTVADECGNISAPQTNTYSWTIDTTAPVITSGVINTNLGCNPATVPVATNLAALITATDNCTLAATNISAQDVVTGCGTTRTFIVTVADECGNISKPQTNTYSWTIDTNAPVINSGAINTNLGCNPAALPVAANMAALIRATDNCTLAATNISTKDFVTACGTTRTFIVTVADECGNVSKPQTNTFVWTIDTNAPVIVSVPASTNLGCNPSILPTDASIQTQVVASDTCTVQSTNVSHVDTTNGCVVSRKFTITAIDECGNISSNKTVVYTWTADTTPPMVTCPPDITISNVSVPYCTFAPGDYGSGCNGSNAASILTNCFKRVYTNGYVKCGITNTPGYCLTFTTCSNVQKFINCGGTPACLTASHSNPTTCEAGNFAGQALCLKLNVDFGDCGSISGYSSRCGDLILNDPTCPLDGQSVRQILNVCHTALGGGSIPFPGCTISNLNVLCSNLNWSFDCGNRSSWCQGHLIPPAITNVSPTVTGYATVVDKCTSTPFLSYTDVITAGVCGGNYVIARTWTAIDECGNSNYCTQNIYVGSSEASVCGTVFLDCNGDGFLTPGIDAGIANIPVTLKNSQGSIVATNLSGQDGAYCFYELAPGTYTISINEPTNCIQTAGTHTNHWINGSGQQCWNENDGYQHCKGSDGVDRWTANDSYQHWKNTSGQDCWTDKYGVSHSQACTYVSCDVPKNNAETFTLTPCESLTCVNFAYQGVSPKPTVCVTGPSSGYCGQSVTYTCCITNLGTACFTSCQVTACGKTITCPPLSPGQGCSIPVNYQYQWSDCGGFSCQATASCSYPSSNNPCTAQASCNTWVNW